MDLRSYTKQELALLYFPDSDPDVARAHLMRWIVRCTQLYEQLQKSGYNKSCKEFNPLQVSYIFFHLGEPWYLSVIIGEQQWATMSIGELGKWNVVSLHCDSEREVSHGSHRSHGSSFVASNGTLTKAHSKNSVRSKNPWDPCGKTKPPRGENFVRFERFVFKNQALRSAHSTLTINHLNT